MTIAESILIHNTRMLDVENVEEGFNGLALALIVYVDRHIEVNVFVLNIMLPIVQ